MATLTGKTIADTYTSLLKLEGDTQTLTTRALGDAIQVKTGDDETTPLYLNTDAVGIGTSTPAKSLVVAGSGQQEIHLDAATNAYLLLDAGGNSDKSNVIFQKAGSTVGAIQYHHNATATSESLRIVVNESGNVDPQMVVQADGNVGIGTTAPGNRVLSTTGCSVLEVAGTPDASDDGATIVLRNLDTSIVGDTMGSIKCIGDDVHSTEEGLGAEIRFTSAGTWNGTTYDYPAQIGFFTNDGTTGSASAFAERMTIKNTGKVGIGTTAPQKQFEIEQDLSSGGGTLSLACSETSVEATNLIGQIYFRGRDADTYATGAKIVAMGENTWGDLSSDDDDAPASLRFYTQSDGTGDTLGTAAMVIDENQNVGIGTENPLHRFVIKSSTSGASDVPSYIALEDDDAVLHGFIGTCWNNGDPGYHFLHMGSSYYTGTSWITNYGATYGSSHVCQIIQDTSGIRFLTEDSQAGGSSNTQRTDSVATFDGYERMRIDVATGRVGIGTTSPEALLHVESSGDAGIIVRADNDNSGEADNPYVFLQQDYAASGASGVRSDGIFAIEGNAGVTYTGSLANAVYLQAQNSTSDGSVTGNLQFVTGGNNGQDTDHSGVAGTARMTINAAGNVGIGTTTPGTPLDVRGSSNSAAMLTVINEGDHANAFGVVIHAGTDAASSGSAADSRPLVFNDGDGTALGGVNAGTTGAPAFYAPSDERLKENIVNTAIVGLDVINNLPLKKFNFKKFGTNATTDIGFIAQDCESVYPKMVSELDDDASKANWNVDHAVKTVSDTTLIPVLVKAIQELSAKVTALENA